MKTFEDIQTWHKARILCKSIYNACSECRDFGFKDQIQRASVSVMNNIAEGFERGTSKEFRQFLYIARGSCGEVRSMCYLGTDLGYFDYELANELLKQSEEISKMIHGLIKVIGKETPHA